MNTSNLKLSSMLNMNRRQFLVTTATTGAGLVLGFQMPNRAFGASGQDTSEINAWVVIQPDDSVIIRTARVEMGQGTLTGLAQLVA